MRWQLWSMIALIPLSMTAQEAARLPAGVMAGHILQKFNPVYPPEAKKAHVEGSVVMHAIIGRDGHVQNLTVISGPDMLRDAAVDAVKQWVYSPYLLNGEPTDVDTTITVNFQFAPAPLPALPDGRIRVSSGVMLANRIKGQLPVFPPEAKQAHISGTVVMHVVIGKDGKVIEIAPISGPEMLRKPFMDAVSAWEYKPYLLNGEPVEVDTIITINIDFGG